MKGSLREHITSIHEKKKPYSCPICSQSFSMKKDLSQHVQCVHDGIKKFECPFCGRKFGLNHQKTKHIKLSCKVVKKQALDSNVPSKKESNYHCPHCSKSCTNLSDLKKHVTTVHFKIKAFKCNICLKTFGQKCALFQHFRLIHKEKQILLEDKVGERGLLSPKVIN